ncbi:hypothetical protein [Ensifer sp. SL37]|nr:hypothetical protein [Ensifer sp. SL37]MCY1740711.1 hypothetical protein [Ensifer sp. SL37]
MKKFLLLAATVCALSAGASNVALAGEEICIGDGNAQACLISPE